MYIIYIYIHTYIHTFHTYTYIYTYTHQALPVNVQRLDRPPHKRRGALCRGAPRLGRARTRRALARRRQLGDAEVECRRRQAPDEELAFRPQPAAGKQPRRLRAVSRYLGGED